MVRNKMTKQNVVITGMMSKIEKVCQKPPTIPGKIIPVGVSERQMLKDLDINGNGGGLVTSWVESMRASSPTHLNSTPPSHHLPILKDLSALKMFQQIVKASKGKQIVMFLDYDGTLSPIVDDPDRAFMSDSMRRSLRKLARYFPTAIVSGRCRDKVYNFVKLAELYYAGSHGMDIKGPTKGSKYLKGSQGILFQPASEFLPMMDEVYNTLLAKTKPTVGAKVEHNKFCLSVHFRCVDEKKRTELANGVRSVLQEYPKLRLTQGRKVLEIRPAIKWNKGKALEFLLESLGLANCRDVFPVYIGDDRTDEDAFKVLQDRGQGFGILVSKIAKETNASYYLESPVECPQQPGNYECGYYVMKWMYDITVHHALSEANIEEVMNFLERLVKWKRLSLRRQFTL